MLPTVLISEVGSRDGLQSVKATMPTAHKLAWIDALRDAGLREIEVGSFVPARLLAQMADVAEVVRHALTKAGLTVMALVPNIRGAEAAIEAGVHKITLPVSASEAHSWANVRKTQAQMVDEVRRIVELRNERAPQLHIEAGISTAFGCTLQGAVPEEDVVRLAASLAEAGADEIGLSDTTGMANPAQVRRLFDKVRAEIGDRSGAAHLAVTGGLAPVTLPPDASSSGCAIQTRTALLPPALGGERLGLRAPPPALGQHTEILLSELGYAATDIEQLRRANVIGLQPDSALLAAPNILHAALVDCARGSRAP